MTEDRRIRVAKMGDRDDAEQTPMEVDHVHLMSQTTQQSWCGDVWGLEKLKIFHVLLAHAHRTNSTSQYHTGRDIGI